MYNKLKYCGIVSLFIHGLCNAQGIDPTKPYHFEAVPSSEKALISESLEKISSLKLNALWLSKNRHQATINDQLFGIGDHIEGMEILKINSEGVTLRGDLGVEVLTLSNYVSFKKYP